MIQKKISVETKQIIKRIYTNKKQFPKDQEEEDKNMNETPRKIIKPGFKDSEYQRLRNIRNYIIQKKNLQFYDPYPKEFLNYRAIASIIAQGNNHCVINQNMFSSAQMYSSPKSTLQPSSSNKFFGRALAGDIVSKSLVLAQPEKRRPVLVTSRPGTSPDKSLLKSARGNRSESPKKARAKSLARGPVAKLKLKMSKDSENFEVAGWGQETDGSPMACNN